MGIRPRFCLFAIPTVRGYVSTRSKFQHLYHQHVLYSCELITRSNMMNQPVPIPPVSLSEEPVAPPNCISPPLPQDHQPSMPGSPSIKRGVSNIVRPADMMDASDSVKLTGTFKSSGKEGDVFADNYGLSRIEEHAVATMDTVAPSNNDNSYPLSSAIFSTKPDNNGREDSMTCNSKEIPITDDINNFEDVATMDAVAPSNNDNSHPIASTIISTKPDNNGREDSMTCNSKEIPITDDINNFEDVATVDAVAPSNNDNSHPIASAIISTKPDNNGREDSMTCISKEIPITDDINNFEDASNHSESSGSSESIEIISDSEPEEVWAHGPRHISTSCSDDVIQSIMMNNHHHLLPPEEDKPVTYPSDDDPPPVAPPNDGYIPPRLNGGRSVTKEGDLKTDDVKLNDSGIGSNETSTETSEFEDATTDSEISDTDSFDVLTDPEPDEIFGFTSDIEEGLISTSSSPFYELYLLEGKKIKMVLKRENVYEAFQNFYGKDISFLLFDMEHEFINEPGEGCGLTKEAFTLFHEQGRHPQYGGDKQLTPETSGIKSKILARVMYHGFKLTGQFPSFLCTAFIIALITRCNIREYGKDYLMKSFINCVLYNNKAIFLEAANNGLQNMSLNDRNMLFRDINMERRAANLEPRNIDEGNWQEILLDLAHFVLIEKPSCREVIEEFQICMSTDGVPLYDMVEARKQVENTTPTAAAILLKLECAPKNQAEEEAKGFLYRFIGSYFNNRVMAERFLVFCTSSTSLPFERINICFNAENGLSRAVRAHTCGNLLNVPTTYSTFREFRDEFLAILSSKESLVFGFQ
ncbi:uncharacterized protein LOC117109428 [Anneissia japonica]|uniref:uncharacterized protein LOC117109428 n=1 Tax=Anneissia japonica TaxID=1529436 RepID=UPI001425B63A|nr:uncharacterized protein LOC117109428 [Anneissia japonica]